MKNKKRRPKSKWYKLEAFFDGENVHEVAEISPQGNKRPVLLHAQFYDDTGEQILQVVTCNMQGVPPSDLNTLRQTLQAQKIMPTLILPEGVAKFLKLREISDNEALKTINTSKREAQEASGSDPGGNGSSKMTKPV